MASTRRLAAILAADIVGYSRLMGLDEAGTAQALREHRAAADPIIAEHGGRVVKTTGDGVLIEFGSVVGALECALALQHLAAERNAQVPSDRRMEWRIGVHLGDVLIEGDDILGDGVNIAARLEGIAEPNGICISEDAFRQVRGKVKVEFDDLGEQSLKNIARPLRVYRVEQAAGTKQVITPPPPLPLPDKPSIAVRAYKVRTEAVSSVPPVPVPTFPELPRHGLRVPRSATVAASLAAVIGLAIVTWWVWPRAPSTALVETPALTRPHSAPGAANVKGTQADAAPLLSFVVLPFSNLSNDPEQDYFADAITEDLTTDLSRIDGSFVIARNTAFSYKGKPVDVKQIGRDLGVRYVLEGSVRRLGGHVQANVQLIDAESGVHLWADRFETELADLAQAQSEITGRLARTLNLHLVAAAGQQLEEEKRLDPDARDLVMRGRALLLRPFSIASRQEGLQAFEQALGIDPGSVDARIWIANVLVGNILDGWSTTPQQDEARAERLLTEALERNAGTPWPHFVAGLLRRKQNRLPESKIELEEAIALDRNLAPAISQLGITLIYLGQPEAAIPLEEKAIRLDPQSSLDHLCYSALGFAHLLLGHVDEAVDLFRKSRAANPRLAYVHLSLAAALGMKGAVEEARAVLGEAIRLKPAWDTYAHIVADCTYCSNPQFLALADKMVLPGWRRAGLPEQ